MAPTLRSMLRALALSALLSTGAAAQEPPDPPPPPEEAAPIDEPASPPRAAPSQTPSEAAPGESSSTRDEVRQLRREVEELRALVRELQKRLDQGAQPQEPAPPPETAQEPQPPPEAAPPEPSAEPAPTPAPAGSGRALLLPDISLIGGFVSHLSNDRGDPDRGHIFLRELELGFQSYLYPNLRADAFIAMPLSHEEGEHGGHSHGHEASVEEAYVTAERLWRLPLSLRLGKSKAAFGRVNQLHPHSWSYVAQPSALANLVSEESLAGQGANLSALLPTGRLFTQLDLGAWSKAQSGEVAPGEAVGSGAAFRDRFGTARLWSALSVGRSGEVELGLSHAWGRGKSYPLPSTEGAGEGGQGASPTGVASRPAARDEHDHEIPAVGLIDTPRIQLFGADFTYRSYGRGNSRFLLRGEYLRHRHRSPLSRGAADGWYLLADQRLNRYTSLGLLYDRGEYPFSPGLSTWSLSGIFTRQLTEQTYLRAQLRHGDRPGKSAFTEMWLQWVWGMGPHTHNLE